MRMDLILGRRVLKNGLVLATTLITCTALQAEDQSSIQSNSSAQNAGGPQSSERATGASAGSDTRSGQASKQHGNQQEKFVQKALKGGQMEVQMGQMAQQRGQNEQVKTLGQALVRDHTQANQQLQQIAQRLNISATGQQAGQGEDADKHQKHQQEMQKLQSQNGAEFDKEFVRMALKHHKKDIKEFEQAQQQVQDEQLKSFVQQTLPKLRQHLQMAQTAARAVGVDEATLSQDDDASIGVGAPAAGETGAERPRSSLDSDGTSISGDARIGDRELNADVNADIDRNDNSARVDVDTDTDSDGKVFQKGDGKVLGLPTSKTDGKYLGIIPKPGANKDNDADVSIEADADTDSAVGGAARSESGTDRDVKVEVETDRDDR
jgi:putative membrane protein